jgi:hypothetical protein
MGRADGKCLGGVDRAPQSAEGTTGRRFPKISFPCVGMEVANPAYNGVEEQPRVVNVYFVITLSRCECRLQADVSRQAGACGDARK